MRTSGIGHARAGALAESQAEIEQRSQPEVVERHRRGRFGRAVTGDAALHDERCEGVGDARRSQRDHAVDHDRTRVARRPP